jgi:hypothetical protein
MEAVRTRLVLAEYYSTTAHVWAAVDTRNILCKEVAHRAPARRDSIGSEALRAPRSLAMYDTALFPSYEEEHVFNLAELQRHVRGEQNTARLDGDEAAIASTTILLGRIREARDLLRPLQRELSFFHAAARPDAHPAEAATLAPERARALARIGFRGRDDVHQAMQMAAHIASTRVAVPAAWLRQ